MAHSLLISVLVTLLAPAATAPPSETAPAPDDVAPDSASAPELAPDGESAPASDETPAADLAPAGPTSEPIPNPFSAPTPTPTPTTAAVDAPPALMTLPPPPRPIRWRFDIGPTVGGTVVGDRGLRAFGDGRHMPELGVSTVFDFRLAEGRFFVGGGVAYQHIERQGDAYGSQLVTLLDVHEPQVLGRASVMAVEGVDAFARVGVGPSFVHTTYRSDGYERAAQRDVLPRVDARAGLSLYLPKAWLPRKQAARFTAGLDLGLGYAWRGKLVARPELEQGTDVLRATTAAWGELSLHGLSWNLGLFVRVM